MANPKYQAFTDRMGVELDAYNALAEQTFGIPVKQVQQQIGAGPRIGNLPQGTPAALPAPAPTMAPTFGASSLSPMPTGNPAGYPPTALGPTPTSRVVDPGWARARSVIQGGAESNGDPDTLFGNAQAQGGPFAGVRVSEMTIDQALDFQNPNGPYAAYVRGQVGRTATPIGANQVVGTTLAAAKAGLGLRGDEIMTPELQDQIGEWIYKQQGLGAWEAFKGSKQAAPDMRATRAQPGDMTPTDYSKMRAEAEKELTPERRRDQSISATLMALGKGLGQMSHGGDIDVGSLFSEMKDRQDRAKSQLTEVAKLEAMDQQRLQSHAWDVAAQQAGFDNQADMNNWQQRVQLASDARREAETVAAENRAEARGIASENRGENRDVRGEARGVVRDIYAENRGEARDDRGAARDEGFRIAGDVRHEAIGNRGAARDFGYTTQGMLLGETIDNRGSARDEAVRGREAVRDEGFRIAGDVRHEAIDNRGAARDFGYESKGMLLGEQIGNRGAVRDEAIRGREAAQDNVYTTQRDFRLGDINATAAATQNDYTIQRDLLAEAIGNRGAARDNTYTTQRDFRLGDIDAKAAATQNEYTLQRDLLGEKIDTRADARRNQYAEQGDYRAEDINARAAARQNEYGISAEDRAVARDDRKNLAIAGQLKSMYQGQPWADRAAAAAATDPAMAIDWANQQAKDARANAKAAATQQQNENMAKMYAASIPQYPEAEQQLLTAAEAARNGDRVRAGKIYSDVTGLTAGQKDAEYLARGGAGAEAMLKLKRTASGAQDPVEAGYYKTFFTDMDNDNEWMDAAAEKQTQMANMLSMIADPDLDTGAFQQLLLPMSQYLQELGITDPSKVDKQTLFDALSRQVSLNMQKAGQGAISDSERKLFETAAASLGKSPMANEVLLYGQNLAIDRNRSRIELERQYVADHGVEGIKDDAGKHKWVDEQLTKQYGGKEIMKQVHTGEQALAVPVGQPYTIDGEIYINRKDPKTGLMWYDDGTDATRAEHR